MLTMAAFGLLAIRNVPLTLVILAPLAADRMSGALPDDRDRGQRERATIRAVGIGVVVLGLAASMLAWARVDPLAAAPSEAIVQALPDDPAARVLNEYALGGFLAVEGPSGTQVVIDGRADRYSRDYKDAYFSALGSLADWEEFVRRTEPDAAVLSTRTPLAVQLEAEGWPVLERASGVVVLRRPSEETP